MAEYIKREALNKVLVRYLNAPHAQGGHSFGQGMRLAINSCIELANNLSAADVAPVVHARWVWHERAFEYECTACKCRFDYNHTFALFNHGYEYASYCPNCGAKMERGADE